MSPSGSVDCNRARLSPRCSFAAAAAGSFAAATDKSEFRVVGCLASGDDAVAVGDVAVG